MLTELILVGQLKYVLCPSTTLNVTLLRLTLQSSIMIPIIAPALYPLNTNLEYIVVPLINNSPA